MQGLMSIGEFSALSGLSPKRLRTYAVRGLLVPAAVDADSSYRYYSRDQLPVAQLIDALRDAGMPLEQIKAALHDGSEALLDEWAAKVRTDAESRQHAIARARELLASNDKELAPMDRETHERIAAWQVAGRTEAGSIRENNEDTIVVDEHLLAVADGMGGHQAGETASALAGAATRAVFTGRSPDELEAAVRAANWAIWERAGSTPELHGMGTTLCAVGVVGATTVAVANVGDSRAYLARGGGLDALTRDHTVAAELAREGALSPEEAAVHPHRRLLTRALGVGSAVTVDMTCLDVAPGDRLLLCSDGVFNFLADEQLGSLVNAAVSPQDAADAIVDLAVAQGSDDNVSAVVAFVG